MTLQAVDQFVGETARSGDHGGAEPVADNAASATGMPQLIAVARAFKRLSMRETATRTLGC